MMMKIYVDTSVFGGCLTESLRSGRNKLVEEFMRGFKVAVISDLTLRELEDAPLKVRSLVGKYQKNTKNMFLFE